ncbi:MAG: hypothetical protein HY819_22940 [Acidobacteria bacterium]|nr:hypothetical protein [Acidobacteriota bacterium]
MRRFFVALSLVVLLPLITEAYTLVLKDGRRVEVKEKYRIVNDIGVFTLPEGNRFSVTLDKINISATELANGENEGSFIKNATEPTKITDKSVPSDKPIIDQDPIAGSRPIARKITNSDFERYRVRREEMLKDSSNKAKNQPQANNSSNSTNTSENSSSTPALTQAERDAAFLAEYRQKEKNKEEYWRTRSRTLLTEMRVQEEQINSLQAQIEDSRRFQPPASTVSVYNAPAPYVYPSPGVRIGGIPIGIGGGYPNSGGSIVVINQDQGNRGRSLQERLVDIRLKYQETIVRYQEMCEEARRDGALPGWLR